MTKSSAHPSSNEEQCAANLQQIYGLVKLHLHQSAGVLGFPSDLSLLYGLSKDAKLFICPADKRIAMSQKIDGFRTSYEIVNDPLKPGLSKTPAVKIGIVAEKEPNHNGIRYVLFYDGSVKAFDQHQFEKLKKNSFIDLSQSK